MTGRDPISITHSESWRSTLWDDDVPSREAWFVTCPDHPDLGKMHNGEPWGYAKKAYASSVATLHRRRSH